MCVCVWGGGGGGGRVSLCVICLCDACVRACESISVCDSTTLILQPWAEQNVNKCMKIQYAQLFLQSLVSYSFNHVLNTLFKGP